MLSVVAPVPPRIAVRGGGTFEVHRIYCIGRNFADHAREMGTPAAAERGRPVLFLKPADAVVTDGVVPYPPGTCDLHHEVELVVALGRDAPPGELSEASSASLVAGYAVGLDLTRRDLQGEAKAKGLPWDTGKSFDCSAPISEIVPAETISDLGRLSLTLTVNGTEKQRGVLSDMIWSVPEVLMELSRLYALRAGDLVFMGTPAGVGPLQVGDRFDAMLGEVAHLQGRIAAAR